MHAIVVSFANLVRVRFQLVEFSSTAITAEPAEGLKQSKLAGKLADAEHVHDGELEGACLNAGWRFGNGESLCYR